MISRSVYSLKLDKMKKKKRSLYTEYLEVINGAKESVKSTYVILGWATKLTLCKS